jgi:hypothetical protein
VPPSGPRHRLADRYVTPTSAIPCAVNRAGCDALLVRGTGRLSYFDVPLDKRGTHQSVDRAKYYEGMDLGLSRDRTSRYRVFRD